MKNFLAVKKASYYLVIIGSLLLLDGCSNEQPPADRPAPGVMVTEVVIQSISETSEFIGRTGAVNDVDLRARVQGYLLERNFNEGDDIEMGDVLYVIDPDTYASDVAIAEANVEKARAEIVRTSDDLARYQKLIKTQNISEQTLNKAENDKRQADAGLISTQAQLQKAKSDLDHTVIKAPISGRIGRSIASVGNLIEPTSGPLARLVELDPIYVNFSVSERDMISVKERMLQQGQAEHKIPDMKVKLRLPNDQLYSEIGQLDFVDNAVDPKTGTVLVRAKFPNRNKLLVPGLFVRAILGSEKSIDALVIPEQSVQEDQAGKFVMIVDSENRVDIRRIQPGRASNGLLTVLDGLQAGEKVVVEGIQKIRPGMIVQTKDAPLPETSG